jgi:hypothetical protein
MVAYGNKARGQQADASGGAGKEVFAEFIVGPSGFVGHLAVAHGGHDRAVLNGKPVDLNRGEQGVVGIQFLGESGGTARLVFAIGLYPVSIAVYQFLNQFIAFQNYPSVYVISMSIMTC